MAKKAAEIESMWQCLEFSAIAKNFKWNAQVTEQVSHVKCSTLEVPASLTRAEKSLLYSNQEANLMWNASKTPWSFHLIMSTSLAS